MAISVGGKYGRVTFEKGSISEDEPVMIFRARDRMLPKLLRVYEMLCEDSGSPQRHLDCIHSAVVEIKAWQHEHVTKVPS